jgi:hypothetical protein
MRMRRLATTAVGLITISVAFLFSAPAAFAVRVIPPGDTSSVPVTRTAHHTGLYPWQITLIIVAGVLLIAAATAVVVRVSRRSVPRPAVQ